MHRHRVPKITGRRRIDRVVIDHPASVALSPVSIYWYAHALLSRLFPCRLRVDVNVAGTRGL